MTLSAGPALRELHDRFGDRVRFVTLYVREAHPGDRYPQAETFERKLQHARDYAQRDDVEWTVLVDDVDGTLHRALDPKPHAAYLVGSDGTVLWRTLWANDRGVVQTALAAVAAGGLPDDREVSTHVVPMLSGTGSMWETWEAAGGHAKTDVLREAPPMYVSGRLAHVFRPLPPIARGVLGLGLSMAPVVLAAVVLARRGGD
ncbi:MAG: hypothetical protein KY469_06710 [Actinobacteria bacterium]|nr:hypothetical protein [Actinomycetota bacterium]